MNTPTKLAVAVAVFALAACEKKQDAAPAVGAKQGPGLRGRFVAVGIYSPGELWTHVAGPRPTAPATPTPEDDSEIVVVLDSATGEVRQCGNLSGRCLAMNPWSQAVPPTALIKHAADLRAEEKAEAERLERDRRDSPHSELGSGRSSAGLPAGHRGA